MTVHVPIKLTASAQKKLPAAQAARKARASGSGVSSMRAASTQRKARLGGIMKDIRRGMK